jgi:hypothetical protein
METQTVGPTPPPLVSDSGNLRPGTSTANLPVVPDPDRESETAVPVAPREPASTTLGLAQFQQMLVDVMRDPTIRAAILPGPPTPAGSGESFVVF